MASVSITNSIDKAGSATARPIVHSNLFKWPESDGEPLRLVGPNAKSGRVMEQPKVVDSVSCRQMFLRSYTFSRKESFTERTKKCFGRVLMLFRRRASVGRGLKRPRRRRRRTMKVTNKRQMAKKKRAKEASCGGLMLAKLRRLFLGPAMVDKEL